MCYKYNIEFITKPAALEERIKIMTNEQEKRMLELEDRNSMEPRLNTKEELEFQDLLDLYYVNSVVDY